MNPSDKQHSDEELEQQRDDLQEHIRGIGEQLIHSSKPAPITWKGLDGIEESIERFNEAMVAALSEAISPDFIAPLDALAKEVENKPPFDPQADARRRAREDITKKRRELRQRKGRL